MRSSQKDNTIDESYDSKENRNNFGKPKKKMNVLLKILIILITLPVFYIYPFFFIFKSKKLKTKTKVITSLVYFIPLSVFIYSVGNTSSPTTDTSSYQFDLLKEGIEIFQGQLFDPLNYLNDSTSQAALDVLEITNPVNINKPGDYVVVYKVNEEEKVLEVSVLEDPITLLVESITLELGTTFNPEDNIDPQDKTTYDINIDNNVNLSQPGTYSVVYRYKDVEKSIIVTVSKPNTIEYTLTSSEWLIETIDKLGFSENKIVEVDGGDLSGNRKLNVAVDVGFGEREYWAFTNQYGQLVAVVAEEIILQDETTEILLGDGRYYSDEANVPGTEDPDLDNGHVIADSLGGVSNAYNITPQNSILNRFGDQAYMEEWIQKADGASEFIAIITYPNTTTQVPSHYKFTYIINGKQVTDEFDNKNPESTITSSNDGTSINAIAGIPKDDATNSGDESIQGIDKNGNGIVTIAEAKAAGFKMPIRSDHWLYKYMIDGDQDGMVGE